MGYKAINEYKGTDEIFNQCETKFELVSIIPARILEYRKSLDVHSSTQLAVFIIGSDVNNGSSSTNA